jgi:hypothetical protein
MIGCVAALMEDEERREGEAYIIQTQTGNIHGTAVGAEQAHVSISEGDNIDEWLASGAGVRKHSGWETMAKAKASSGL